jgi:glucokinase
MYEARAPQINSLAEFPRLLGDIGGTNARFGWQAAADQPVSHIQTLPCADHATLLNAAQHYLASQQLQGAARAAFGIANPVTGDQVRMTNHHWAFSVEETRAALGLQRLLLVNDFTALALSLQTLPPEHLHQVGGGQAAAGAAVALLGPGTGLGVSGLVPVGPQGPWAALAGEGGHVSIAAMNATEFAVIESIRQRYGHVSAERVVSGTGLPDLHQAVCEVRGQPIQGAWSATQIVQAALAQPDSVAAETMKLFCAFLGDVAGNLALSIGARGGVYIGGGIVPRMLAFFEASPFRQRFEAKGRFQPYLAQVPTWVITSAVSPALQGAANALDNLR